MAGDFGERISELASLVGSGDLQGKLVSDQIYSHFQHERMDLNHPNGGQAKFLETALHTHAGEYFQKVADKVLEGGARDGMIDAVDQLDNDSAELTPKEATVLARSNHLTVTDDGAQVYDKPPQVPRLSEEELRAIHARGVTIHRRRRT